MKRLMLLLCIFLCACNLTADSTETKKPRRWVMVDVNQNGPAQGDAHLVTNGLKTILIDAGKEHRGRDVVVPYLFKENITALDAVFITHPHSDHYGGLIPLLMSDIVIRQIYMNPVSEAAMEREHWGGKMAHINHIRELAAQKKIPIHDYGNFETFVFDEDFVFRKLFVFSEEELEQMGIGPDINELSLIAMLEYKDQKALFPGDLNVKLSEWLVANHKEKIQCDVLKVPHHGAESLASNAFFEVVAPEYALLPAPKPLLMNKRTERARTVLERLNVKTYSNGMNGHVTVWFEDGGIRITTEK